MRLKNIVGFALAGPIFMAKGSQVYVPPAGMVCDLKFTQNHPSGDTYVGSTLSGSVFGCNYDAKLSAPKGVQKNSDDMKAKLLDLVVYNNLLYQVRAIVQDSSIDYILSSEKQRTEISPTKTKDFWIALVSDSVEFIHGVPWKCKDVSHLTPNGAISPENYVSLLSEYDNSPLAGKVGVFHSAAQKGVTLELQSGGVPWVDGQLKQCLKDTLLGFKDGKDMPKFVAAEDFAFMMRRETSQQLFYRHVGALPRKALVNGFAVWDAKKNKFMMFKEDGKWQDLLTTETDQLIAKGLLHKLKDLSVEAAKNETTVATKEYVALATLVVNGEDDKTTKVVIEQLTGESYHDGYHDEFKKHLKSYLDQKDLRTALMKYLLIDHDGVAIDPIYGIEAIALEVPRDTSGNSLLGVNTLFFQLLKDVCGMDKGICAVIPEKMFDGFSYDLIRACLVDKLPNVKTFYDAQKMITGPKSPLQLILDGPKAGILDLSDLLQKANDDQSKGKLIDVVHAIAILKTLKLDSHELDGINKETTFIGHGMSLDMPFWEVLKKAEGHKESKTLTAKLGEYFKRRK